MAIGFDSRWASYNAANRITSYNSKLESSVGRITSGMRINSAADDPAGIVTSEKIRDRIGALDQANINAQNDHALVKTADSYLGEAVDILQRMKELAVHATDSALESGSLTGLDNEFQALNSRLTSLASAKYGGQDLWSALDFNVGVDATQTLSVDLSAASSVFSDTGVTLDSASTAQGALSGLNDQLDKALAEQSKVGGWMNAFGYINEGIENESTNLQSAHSTAYDTDVAREMTSYVKNSVLLQSAQLILSQQNNNAYSVLNLISQ
jgi:flagellin